MLTKRQNIIIMKFVAVVVITTVAGLTMFNVKDFINRREAMLAMQQIGQHILEYEKTNKSLPPASFIEQVQNTIGGSVRLGNVQYRVNQITDIKGPPDTILGYVRKDYYSLFLERGYIVLFLDGSVEWMEVNRFEALFAEQTQH